MNYYSFTEVHRYLRGLAGNRPLYVADLGSRRDERGNPLYPAKTYLLFYLRLGAEAAVPREGPTFPPVAQPSDTRRGT